MPDLPPEPPAVPPSDAPGPATAGTPPDLSPHLVSRPRRRAEWRAAGVTGHELATSGLWQPVLRGVHAFMPEDVTDPQTRIKAAIACKHSDVALGGWAALAWQGLRALDGRTGPGASTLIPITFCVGPVGRMRKRTGLDIDRSTLLDVDLTEHQGILVTAPARSCLDIMRRLGVEEGLVAADATLRAGLTTREELEDALRRLTGLPGVPRARLGVQLADGRAESGPESRFRYVWVVEARLPIPLVNPEVVDRHGTFVARTDLLDPEAGTVGEYDGKQHLDLVQHTADNAREEDVEHLNLTVTRATSIDLWPQRRRLVSRLQVAHRRGTSRDRSRDAWGYRLS